MNNGMLGQAMLITYAEMGVVIDKFDDVDEGVILLFTVPKTSYNIDAKGEQMAGKHLASRVKHTLEDFGMVFADIRYHVRDEHWDKTKAEIAKRAAYKDMGYKDWQINKRV
jgi:hypothetical protein